jgi:hypothetical protein
MEQKEVHLLTLKVMRLSRPGFQVAPTVLCESTDIPFDALVPNESTSGIEAFGMTSFLQLPNNFGIIYLGEVFRIYISLNNPTPHEVYSTTLKVELQTSAQWIRLFESIDDRQGPIAKFGPGESHDYVISHEVKEGGVNILSCTVNYETQNKEKKSFRKFFKFQVMNPLTITPRIHSIQDTVYLEATIENSTQSPLFIETVKMEPTELFSCSDLNAAPPAPNIPNSDVIFSHSIVYMKPATARQYLFMLVPKTPGSTEAKIAQVVGKLEITWRSTLGEVGRLQTAPLQRKVSVDEVELTLANTPPRIVLEQPFAITLQLINKGAKSITPLLVMQKNTTRWIIGKWAPFSRVRGATARCYKITSSTYVSNKARYTKDNRICSACT